MGVIVAAWLAQSHPPLPFVVAGVVLAIAGVVLVAWARRALGASFTVFPEPRGPLVAAGPYRLARHPMYGGGLLTLGGISLARSWIAVALTVVLGILWWRKSVVEERRLGPQYAEYRRRTPRRFFPLPWPRDHAP